MEGWVDLGYPAMHRPGLGVELAISRSLVRRPTTTLTEQPESVLDNYRSCVISLWRSDIFFAFCFNTVTSARRYCDQACLLVRSFDTLVVIFRNRFLLLARYVPNVAKRSIWEQCKKKYILMTDQRPTGLPLIWPILGKFQMAIYPRGVVRSTSCLVLRWGFRGRRIEWR